MNRIIFLFIALVLSANTTFGMGRVREWIDKQTNTPPVVVTNAPPEQPVPQPSGYQWEASKLVIAGVDRDWYYLDPAEVCKAVAQSGCNAISLEMVGNDQPRTESQLQAKYNAYLVQTRKYKLVMFVCVVNDWVKSSFYSDGSATKMLNVVLNGGPEGVIAQPVGETHTAQGKAFEADAVKKLKTKGFKTCNNNPARATGKNGMDYFAWHTCGYPSTAPKGAIEITDCGNPIRDIGYFNADKVEKYANAAKDRGAGFGLYRYVGMGDNGSPKSLPVSASVESWKRMAKVYGGSTAESAPPVVNNGDAIDISTAILLGPHKNKNPKNAKITRTIKSATLTSTTLSFSHDALNWPSNSPIGSDIDRRVYVYWMDGGRLTGGHYDWGRPNTRQKDLVNIREGYLDGRKPPVGANIWICFMNDWIGSGAERTQVIKCEGTWR